MNEFEITPEELRRLREEAEARAKREDELRSSSEAVPSYISSDPKPLPAAVEVPRPPPPPPAIGSNVERKPLWIRRLLTTAAWFIGGIVLFFVVAFLAAKGCETWVYPYISPEPLIKGMNWVDYQKAFHEDRNDLPSLRSPEGRQWSEKHLEWRRKQSTFLNVFGLASGFVFAFFYYKLYQAVS